MKSTKLCSLTANSGASRLPSIGNAFMYIESSSSESNSDIVFVVFNGWILFKLLISLSIGTDFQL